MASRLFGVSYDLPKPGQDYPSLTTALKNLGAKKILQSHWVLRSASTAVELREHLKPFIDSNDRLFVDQISEWASHKTLATPKDL